ncbi:Dynein beta chain, ciliary, partial [Pseudolycoriella hygida]
ILDPMILYLQYVIMEWLNNTNKRILIISSQISGNLVPALGFPTHLKGKSCYFVKRHLTDLTIENMLTNVLCGDVSSNTVDCLSALVDGVVYPLLCNAQNRCLWPEVIVKDIDNQMLSIRNTLAEVKGKFVNKTILPIPIGIEEILTIAENVLCGDVTALSLQMKNKLEGMVIKWCHQMDDVINTKAMNMNLNPVPADEYNYWTLRHSNLENIYNQVTAHSINTILMILKSIDSVYYSSFHSIFQRTVSSLNEARDIRIYLNPLASQTRLFESNDFNLVKPFIKPLLHSMALTWANSTYYCTKDHWSRYLLSVCNLLIRESVKNLDSSTIFQGDSEESLNRMDETIDILECFKKEVLTTKSELSKYKKAETNPIPWSFQANTVFKRLNLYIKRLNDIRNVFVTANEFSKLDRIEIGGIKGRNLSRGITDALLEYQKLYSRWSSVDFDPLDADGTALAFEKIQNEYQENADKIERSLAQIFTESLQDCYTTEHCFQLIEMSGTLFNSKVIQEELKDKYQMILDLYGKEVETINENFEKIHEDFKKVGLEAIPIDKCYPKVAGSLIWAYKLRTRLTAPIIDLELVESPEILRLFHESEGLKIIERKNELESRLLEFERTIFENWKCSVVTDVPRCMEKTLLRRSTEKLLSLNFDQMLVAALKEIKTIKCNCWDYGNEIPAEGQHLFQLDESLWKSRTMLSRIVEWYNFLRTETQSCEFNIISTQVDKIDVDLEDAIKISTWNSYSK